MFFGNLFLTAYQRCTWRFTIAKWTKKWRICLLHKKWIIRNKVQHLRIYFILLTYNIINGFYSFSVYLIFLPWQESIAPALYWLVQLRHITKIMISFKMHLLTHEAIIHINNNAPAPNHLNAKFWRRMHYYSTSHIVYK